MKNDDNNVNNSTNTEDNENYVGKQIEKTIKCWKCDTIMKVKVEWKIVQCPTCEKVCKIPETSNNNISSNFNNYQLNNLQFNDNVNHFDVNVPCVYVLIICPFCKTDNKVRATSEHMVCYRCHNSVNICHDKKSKENTVYKSNNFTGNNSSNPTRKSIRFSDLFFPDPMFYPGYYPVNNSYSPLYPTYDPYAMAEYLHKKNNYDLFRYRLEKNKMKKLEEGKLISRIREIKRDCGIIDRIENVKENISIGKNNQKQAIYKSMFGVI